MKDTASRFVELTAHKKNPDEGRTFFLEQIEDDYSPLLWKCYLTHMKEKKDDCARAERVALLGSSNIQPLKDMLWAVFHANKIHTDYYIGEYGNYLQELAINASSLYFFKPTVTIVVLSLADLIPSIYEDPFSYNAESIDAMISKASQDLALALRQYSSALVNNTTYLAIVPSYEDPSSYVYSPGPAYKTDNYMMKLQNAMEKLEEGIENIASLNIRKLICKHPADKIEDKRYWYLGRIRYTDLFFSEIAKEVAVLYGMLRAPSKKCLILDLDNTLWGGVIGQDGLENIILGQDGLGKAFQDFQREILKLYKKGIMLAICSKNNEADAMEVFDKHTEMVLKKDHFAARCINWDDKVTNIKNIAEDINIGLDSIVFLDDDPAEKKWVRDNLPQVTVPDLPTDSFLYAEFLKNSKWFNSYRLSEEDMARNITYRAVEKTRHLKAAAGDERAFLKGLNQTVSLETVNVSTLLRAAQLCQKTNQFNLTTRRYRASDLKEMMKHKPNHLYTIRVKDCFCDYGVVGLLILKDSQADGEVSIDTFLLSCRIIGRRIEFAILDWLKDIYKKRGFGRIRGLYSRTEKNAVSSELYAASGFIPASKDKEGQSYYYSLGKVLKPSSFNKLIRVFQKRV